MPGVSMATNALSSSSNRTSTLSRVVPGTSLTIIRSAPASVFTNVLLPTLRRPTMATRISGSRPDRPRPPSRGAARRRCDQQGMFLAAVLERADLHRHAVAELAELVGLVVEGLVVGLVGDAEDRRVEVPQPLGDLLVHRAAGRCAYRPRTGSGPPSRSRVGDLLLDVLGELVRVHVAHAAGVDQLEEAVVVLHQVDDPVAGDPRACRRRSPRDGRRASSSGCSCRRWGGRRWRLGERP